MIEFQDVGVQAGAFALQNVNLRIGRGAYTVLLGSTGSGKTTLLELLCGLRRPQHGRILLNGSDVTALDPAERGIGYVPQDGALFPAMTVAKQIALPLEVRKVPRPEIRKRVAEISEKLGVQHLLKRYPRTGGAAGSSGGSSNSGGLSGGERQRVALARALVFEPFVLCLDEPLSAVDEETRVQLYPLLRSTTHDFGATVLHVTHSSSESRVLASHGLRLVNGKLETWQPEPTSNAETESAAMPPAE
ncbi:MAG: ATP-binding cassette domain-containing protein [Planctomycetes bacterium]|nr:ATP-binding cassette domain-containing protein [Planctomycetota bacterium]